MTLQKILKIADDFASKLDLSKLDLDVNKVVKEHPNMKPVSYMAVANLENMISDSKDLLHIMNDKDDLPQWADEAISIAKHNLNKILEYVKSVKTAEMINRQDMIKLAAGKYDHIDFKPSESAASSAARGLELRKKNKGKGGLNVQQAHKQGIGSGVARAVSLKNRKTLSPSTVRRMKAFFDRHEKNKGASGGKSLSQDKGYVAWLLWGGDAGRAWANKVCRQMDSADKKSK